MKHLNTLVALCLCILGSIGTAEAQTEETVTVNGLTYVIYEIEEWSATEGANVKTKQAFVKEVDADLTDAIILDSLRHQGVSYPVSGTTTYNSQGKEPFREHTALHSVTIPATMKYLNPGAFAGCTNLSTVTFDPESRVTLTGPVFYDCTSLTELDFPARVSFEPGALGSHNYQAKGVLYGSGVKHIRFSGEIWPEKNYQSYFTVGAFEGSPELESVELAEGITYIPYRCFINCPKLASVTLPQSLDEVDAGAFGNPNYPNSTGPFMLNQPDGVIYLGNTAYVYKGDIAPGTIIDIRPGTRYISNELLFDEKKLAEATIRIPKSVEKIRGNITANMEFEDGNPVYPCIDGVRYADSGAALADATNLTVSDFTIPSGVEYIYNDAFKNCKALRSLTIPGSVRYFSSFFSPVFLGENVQSLTIQSRNVLRENTFADCPSLKEVTIDCNYNRHGGIEDDWFFKDEFLNNGEAYVSMNLFSNCPNIETLTFTDGVDYIAPLFSKTDSVGIQTLNLPAHVKWIGDGAFRNFTRIKTVILPRMEMCGNGLFRRCTALETVNLPDGLTQLGDSTFMDCKSLKEVIIPSSLTAIGTAVFHGCSKLTTINLENVESIGNYCFMWCDSLNEVNAPAFRPGDTYHPMEGSGYSRTGGVYYLGTTACGYDISMPDSVPVPIDIREGTTDIQSYAFSHTNALHRGPKTLQYPIRIANSVRNIGKEAFNVLRSRTGLMADFFNLPADVEHIGDEAFRSFTLRDTLFILPANVKSVGNRAFVLSPNAGDTLRIYVQNAEPCEIYAYSFGAPSTKRRCILYVPAGSKEAYAGSKWAVICKEIREYDSLPTAIHTPATDNSRNIQITPGGIYVGGPARVYSPDGRLVDETRKATLLNLPKQRTYIVTCGGASVKVYVP